MNFGRGLPPRESPSGHRNIEFRSFANTLSCRRDRTAHVICRSFSIEASSGAYSPLEAYKLRQVTIEDIPQAASICFEAFNGKGGNRLRTLDQWERQLTSALASKKAAHREARIYRLVNQSETLRAQLAALNDPIARSNDFPDSAQAKAILRRQLRRRTFYCLVAEDRTTSQIVGCVALTLANPEAVLPPPFPTSARLRCYVSNMAVAPEHRRKGVASILIARCERLARLLGQPEVWLHVDPGNDPAELLYRGLGYEDVSWIGGPLSWVFPATRPRLLAKNLPPVLRKAAAGRRKEEEGEKVVGSRAANGVFVWEVDSSEKEAEQPLVGGGLKSLEESTEFE